jgi:hypothetical protein
MSHPSPCCAQCHSYFTSGESSIRQPFVVFRLLLVSLSLFGRTHTPTYTHTHTHTHTFRYTYKHAYPQTFYLSLSLAHVTGNHAPAQRGLYYNISERQIVDTNDHWSVARVSSRTDSNGLLIGEELLHLTSESDITHRETGALVCSQSHFHSVVHVEPLRMMISLWDNASECEEDD